MSPASLATRAPFTNTEQAWFATMAALKARKDRAPHPGLPRFDPNEIIQVLDQLYRRRRIDLVHSRVLRLWGERGVAPDKNVTSERADYNLWTEVLERLDWPLRVKGIVR